MTRNDNNGNRDGDGDGDGALKKIEISDQIVSSPLLFNKGYKRPTDKVENEPKRCFYEDLDRPWNYRIMLQLKQIGERSQGYKWMHNEESEYMTKFLQRLTLAEIIFTTLHGASLASEFVAIFNDMGTLILVIFTCLQAALYVVSTVLKTYKEGSDFSSKIAAHHNTSIRFSSLAIQIQNQFCLPVAKRSDDESFLEYKSNEFNDILLGAPSVREKIRNAYLESVKNIDIAKPQTFGNIEIVIDKNEEPKNKDNDENKDNEIEIRDDKNKEIDRQLQFDINRFLGIINRV